MQAPTTPAAAANLVCSHGRMESAAPGTSHRSDAANRTGAASRALPASSSRRSPTSSRTSAATPVSTRTAPGPSGNTAAAWQRNGADRHTAAHPNHAAPALAVSA